MSFPGLRTYRGASLEELLPRIRQELGADAVVLAERNGIVGGIGGFFGRRCIEIDAAPAAMTGTTGTVPFATAAAAYASFDAYDDDPGSSPRAYPPEWSMDTSTAASDDDDVVVPSAETGFAGILAGFVPTHETVTESHGLELPAAVSVGRSPRAPAGAPEIDPTVWEELTVRHTLAAFGFRPRSIESILSLTLEHIRPLAPELPLAASVRAAITGALHTPRGWNGKRKTIVLAGLEDSGAGEVAAGLAASYAAAGRRVALLGLAGPRAAVSLAMGTDDVDVSFGICDEPDDVPRVLARLGEVQVLIAVAPSFRDRGSAEHVGAMVAPLGRVETHLVLPAAAPAEEARRTHDVLESGTHVHCLLPTGIDSARAIGGTLSLALEAALAVRWTTDLDLGGQPTPADVAHLARLVLP